MRPEQRVTRWLFDPFAVLAGGPALALGGVVMLLTALLCWQSGVALDGVLDAHYAQTAAPHYAILVLVDWAALTACLWIAGQAVGRGAFRTLDLAGTLAVARWPMLLVVGLLSLPPIRAALGRTVAAVQAGNVAPPFFDTVVLTGFGLSVLALTLWFVYLAWRAFSISCDARGTRSAVAFALALGAAELATWWFARWLLVG